MVPGVSLGTDGSICAREATVAGAGVRSTGDAGAAASVCTTGRSNRGLARYSRASRPILAADGLAESSAVTC